MTALGILLLLFWLSVELGYHDLAQPEPDDPYRLDRWKNNGT